MIKVKFYEAFKEEKKLIRELLPPNISAVFESKTIQESQDKKIPAQLISIRTQSIVPPNWVLNLDGILTRSQGYDHLLPIVQKNIKEVKCGYLGCYCAEAVAQHALITAQMLLRKMKKQIKYFDTFNREGITGSDIYQKKALVVGVGNIGKRIVQFAKKNGMNVKGVDLVRSTKSLEYVALKSGVRWADIIFCALPLTDQTVRLLNYKLFQSAGKGKYLINVSRGEITPTADLKKMLDKNLLAGLSLDVYEHESIAAEYLRNKRKAKISSKVSNILNLKDRDNVIFTPHNAFNTEEALREKCRLTVQEVVRFLKTKQFRWRV